MSLFYPHGRVVTAALVAALLQRALHRTKKNNMTLWRIAAEGASSDKKKKHDLDRTTDSDPYRKCLPRSWKIVSLLFAPFPAPPTKKLPFS